MMDVMEEDEVVGGNNGRVSVVTSRTSGEARSGQGGRRFSPRGTPRDTPRDTPRVLPRRYHHRRNQAAAINMPHTLQRTMSPMSWRVLRLPVGVQLLCGCVMVVMPVYTLYRVHDLVEREERSEEDGEPSSVDDAKLCISLVLVRVMAFFDFVAAVIYLSLGVSTLDTAVRRSPHHPSSSPCCRAPATFALAALTAIFIGTIHVINLSNVIHTGCTDVTQYVIACISLLTDVSVLCTSSSVCCCSTLTLLDSDLATPGDPQLDLVPPSYDQVVAAIRQSGGGRVNGGASLTSSRRSSVDDWKLPTYQDVCGDDLSVGSADWI